MAGTGRGSNPTVTGLETSILKRSAVKMGPSRCDSPAGEAAAAACGAPPAQAAPKARVIQQDEDKAVIEVVCPCGRRTFVHCLYRQGSSE